MALKKKPAQDIFPDEKLKAMGFKKKRVLHDDHKYYEFMIKITKELGVMVTKSYDKPDNKWIFSSNKVEIGISGNNWQIPAFAEWAELPIENIYVLKAFLITLGVIESDTKPKRLLD